MLQGLIQIALTLLIVITITPFFGRYMGHVFQEQRTFLDPILNPVERVLYSLIGVQTKENMTGWQYARAIIYSNIVMALLVFLLILNQGWLPLNPTKVGAPTWDTALHTTISFITNTNQQHYSGETYLSYGSQMLGLGYHMFTSAATGIAVAIAFIRGLTGKPLGNFYVDLIRSITRILLPISIVGAIALMAGGVPETLAGPVVVPTLEDPSISQAITRGPVAHFEIIKELGENGGGFFAINSAHPYENPNAFVNLIQLIAIMIPAGIALAFPDQFAGISNPGFHGFAQVIYEYASAAANNGSGFEGLGDSQPSPSPLPMISQGLMF